MEARIYLGMCIFGRGGGCRSRCLKVYGGEKGKGGSLDLCARMLGHTQDQGSSFFHTHAHTRTHTLKLHDQMLVFPLWHRGRTCLLCPETAMFSRHPNDGLCSNSGLSCVCVCLCVCMCMHVCSCEKEISLCQSPNTKIIPIPVTVLPFMLSTLSLKGMSI